MNYIVSLLFVTVMSLFSISYGSEAIPRYFGQTVDSEEINLTDYKGKVVVVTFWAGWCPQCRKELPVLNSIANKVSEDDLVVIAINYKETKRKYRKFLKNYKNSRIIFTHDEYGVIGREYDFEGVPYLMMFDHTGKRRYIHIGFGKTSLVDIVERVNRYLTEKSSALKDGK